MLAASPQASANSAPTFPGPNWRTMNQAQFNSLWRVGSFQSAWQKAATVNMGGGSTLKTFFYGNRWFATTLRGNQYGYYIYIPGPVGGAAMTQANPLQRAASAFRLGAFFAQDDTSNDTALPPNIENSGPGSGSQAGTVPLNATSTPEQGTPGTSTTPNGSGGAALAAAAAALDSLLQSSGAPAYTSGQGPSNPTVAAFQTAWNNDPVGANAPLEVDGEYGTNTQTAMSILGYTEPAPNVTPGSGTDNASTPGYTGQQGGTPVPNAGNGFTILGMPWWMVAGGAALGAAGVAAVMAHPKGKAALRRAHGHVTRSMHRARRYGRETQRQAARLLPR